MPMFQKLRARFRGRHDAEPQSTSTSPDSSSPIHFPTKNRKLPRTPLRRASRSSVTLNPGTTVDAAVLDAPDNEDSFVAKYSSALPKESRRSGRVKPTRIVPELSSASKTNGYSPNGESLLVGSGKGMLPPSREVAPLIPPGVDVRQPANFWKARYSFSSCKSIGRSSRSTIIETTSRFRRLIREAWNGTVASRNSELSLDDVPDVDDNYLLKRFSPGADASITKYAQENYEAHAINSAADYSSDSDRVNDRAMDDFSLRRSVAPIIPEEVPGGALCNDGMVSFVVPLGWIAMKSVDCVLLYNGRCFGYVRSVSAIFAAQSLLETERLQVMSHVYTLSSPVLDGLYATIQYASPLGIGKG